jgi:hypothetical protein
MPKPIRALLCALVVLLAIGVFAFRDALGMNAHPALFFALCAGMIGAVWLFPEFKREG